MEKTLGLNGPTHLSEPQPFCMSMFHLEMGCGTYFWSEGAWCQSAGRANGWGRPGVGHQGRTVHTPHMRRAGQGPQLLFFISFWTSELLFVTSTLLPTLYALANFTSRETLTFLILFLDPQAVLLHSSCAVCPCFDSFAFPFGSLVHWEAPRLGKQAFSWNSWSGCPREPVVPQLPVFALKITQLLASFFSSSSFQGNSSQQYPKQAQICSLEGESWFCSLPAQFSSSAWSQSPHGEEVAPRSQLSAHH